MTYDIYLRAHTVQLEGQERKRTRKDEERNWPDYVLVFDCETRITADQTLTFGFWRFCALRNSMYVCTEEGIFHNDDGLTAKEFALLREYVKGTKPDTTDDGSDRLRLYSRSKFIQEVFGIAIQARALIVCFNAGFDLSRLAVDWENAKNGGWSLILSQWRNPQTTNLEANIFFPRVVIKALNSKTAIIHSTRAPMSVPGKKNKHVKLWPAARFLDVRTLLWALQNRSYSLKRACEELKTEHQKINHAPTGTITHEEIEYARNDVACTVDVLNAAKREYDLHPIDLRPDLMFSPASVAKSYLEKLNILHPNNKIKDADAAYGIFMQSYFGGRAECRIRNWEVPVCPVDFMSQYSTVNELLDNWSVVVAKEVIFPDVTDEVRQFLSEITLERCFEREMWSRFRFFALVRPDDDILPVRTVYNGTTQNIGINYLTSKEAIWFAGPDIIASILLTGKVPNIERAIRVVAHGKQPELAATSLRGMVNVDANKDSLFKHVVEQKEAHESNPALQYWLKILASSGSYGLFVELNPNESDATKLRVFSGEDSFETTSDAVEEPGKWFAPHIASLITAGGRLLLGMLEKCIVDAGGTFLFCDTDSAAIVATKDGRQIAMPDCAEVITALSWAEVERIVNRFESLNPYDRKLVPGSILKIHKLNWDGNKQRRQLFGYSVAAKRYALYTKTCNDLEIVEPKAHGLGYFYPPKDSPEGWKHEIPLWVFEAWEWIVRGVLGLERTKPQWFDLPVMMKLTLSTPHHALRNLAKGPLTRPFNFTMLPQICRFGCPQNVDPDKFTLITPFSSERDEWMHSKCINIHDPNSPVYELTDEYDFRTALPKNFFMLLNSYQNHPEAKSLGPEGKQCEFNTRGLLQRAHIIANWPPVYIGKESDRHWEEGEDLSLLEFQAIQYKRKGNAVADEEQLAQISKIPKREFMRRGINQHTLEKICRREPVRASKLAKCLKTLEEYEQQEP
jgi:DNA polymerase elongation subunit (family B)